MRFKKNNPILIFLAAGGLLFFLHTLGILSPLENFLLTTVKPIGSSLHGWSASFNHSYKATKDQNDLNARIDQLTKEVAALNVANSQLQETADENKKLRSTLDFIKTNNLKAVVAGVIARDASTEDSRDLILNRGSHDGLQPGLGVVSEEGVIVGKIVETKDTTSKICLTTSPNCQLAASIQNENKTQGITDGDLGLTIKMSYIPQLEKIAAGDTVITSGLGGSVPRGLVIGKITQVRNESNEVWQEATIEPLINQDNLTVVSVIIP